MAIAGKELAAIAAGLCDRFYPYCITRKCPMQKYGCYDHANFETFYRHISPGARKGVGRVLRKYQREQEAAQNEQVPQQKNGD